MDKITIDGRALVLFMVLVISFLIFLVQTLNVWLENQDHRKARAWDNDKCRANFIDWFAGRVEANPFFVKALIIGSLPVVIIWALAKHPVLFIRKAQKHFNQQVNSITDYLRK